MAIEADQKVGKLVNVRSTKINSKRLRFARVQAGLTQEQAAHVVSAAAATISNIETGRAQPTLRDVERLSRYYSRSSDWFAEVDDPDEKMEPPGTLNAIFEVVALAASLYADRPKRLEHVLNQLRVALSLAMAMYPRVAKAVAAGGQGSRHGWPRESPTRGFD